MVLRKLVCRVSIYPLIEVALNVFMVVKASAALFIGFKSAEMDSKIFPSENGMHRARCCLKVGSKALKLSILHQYYSRSFIYH